MVTEFSPRSSARGAVDRGLHEPAQVAALRGGPQPVQVPDHPHGEHPRGADEREPGERHPDPRDGEDQDREDRHQDEAPADVVSSISRI